MIARKLACVIAALVFAACAAQPAMAQSGYPAKPIRLVIAYAPGGPGDILGRLLADRVSIELGQTVFVDNRPGGNSTIGTNAVAKAEPDGYTILQVTGAQNIVKFLQPVPFDFDKDLTPIIGVGATPLVLAVPASIKSIDDLIALSKTTQGGINYGTSGVGSVAHLSAALFTMDRKINATAVPYKGGGPAIQALMANQIQYFFASPVEAAGLSDSADIRLLAVTSEQRVSNLPKVPTMKELGLGNNDPRIWYGYYAPAKTSAAIIDRLYKAFATAMADPAVQTRLQSMGFIVKVDEPAAVTKFIQAESARWKKVIEENNIKAAD